jgi:hypothetical protein
MYRLPSSITSAGSTDCDGSHDDFGVGSLGSDVNGQLEALTYGNWAELLFAAFSKRHAFVWICFHYNAIRMMCWQLKETSINTMPRMVHVF